MEEKKEVNLEVNDLDNMAKLMEDVSANKPSEEEIAEAKKDWEDSANEWSEMIFKVGKPKDSTEFCEYLMYYLETKFMWTKDAWMGVIKLTEELEEAREKMNKRRGLELGYQALEFAFYVLSNPGGIGLKSAQTFEKDSDLHVRVLQALGEKVEEARKRLKEIEFKQQKWGAMQQGFYLEEEKLEEQLEEADKEEVKKRVKEIQRLQQKNRDI